MTEKQYHHGDLKNALIKAGVEILAKEGAGALSLRKVARQAGVSHAAPYAHFTDKQALIAAISTEGFKALLSNLEGIISEYTGQPQRKLIESAWAYAQFAMNETDTFKIMFSDMLEKEKDYPAFVQVSQRAFELVVELVSTCQQAGILRSSPPDIMAVTVWSQIHGFLALLVEGQVSHTVFERIDVRKMLIFSLNQIMLVPYQDE